MEITNTSTTTNNYHNPFQDENTSEEIISKNPKIKEEKVNLKSEESENQKEKTAFNIKIADKTLMDLKDMQNFLFMMIGLDIKIEAENVETGSNINILS
jgi:hypothetical protein